MRVTYLASHLKSAQNLYRQRAQALQAAAAPASSLESLEGRLRLHLYALAEAGHADPEPAEPPAAFVATAATLLRGEAEAAPAAWALAAADPALLEPVQEALALFPPPEPQALFERLYEAQPALRAALLDLYRRLEVALPAALISQAELQGEDPALTAAALGYAAARVQEFGLEMLRPYYRAEQAAPAARLAALWGGLLRADPQVTGALAQAVDGVPEDHRRQALRLLALSGEPQYLPILRQTAADQPAEGMELLALHGQREAVAELLSGLERAESAVPAAAAWQRLFATELPLKPRLGVVEGEAQTPVPEAGELPDVGAARAQWEACQGRWASGERWRAGAALTPPHLATLACQQGGRAGADALALLALHTAGQTQCDPRQWLALRRARLAPLITAAAQTSEETAHA